MTVWHPQLKEMQGRPRWRKCYPCYPCYPCYHKSSGGTKRLTTTSGNCDTWGLFSRRVGANWQMCRGGSTDQPCCYELRFGKMRHIWRSSDLHLRLRMRLYISSVCSILTYGSEAWNVTKEVRQKLNGVNSRIVSIMTGKTPHEETSDGTRSFDLFKNGARQTLKAVKHQCEDGTKL